MKLVWPFSMSVKYRKPYKIKESYIYFVLFFDKTMSDKYDDKRPYFHFIICKKTFFHITFLLQKWWKSLKWILHSWNCKSISCNVVRVQWKYIELLMGGDQMNLRLWSTLNSIQFYLFILNFRNKVPKEKSLSQLISW